MVLTLLFKREIIAETICFIIVEWVGGREVAVRGGSRPGWREEGKTVSQEIAGFGKSELNHHSVFSLQKSLQSQPNISKYAIRSLSDEV